MRNLLKADLYRFRKSIPLKVAFLLSFMSVLTLAIILYSISHGNIDKEIMGALPILTDAMMVSLLSSLVTGLIICGDFKSKTIHSEIAAEGRKTIVLEKTITNLLITAIVLFPYAALAVIAFISGADFAELEGIPSLFINILTNQADVSVDGLSIGKAITLCLIGIFVYTARLSICVPVAFIVRKPAAVIAAGVVSAFGFDLIVKGVEDVPVLGSIMAHTPYAIIYDLSMDAGINMMLKAIITSTVFIILMAIITFAHFRESEIK